ncbi:DUF3828 domain-containing protein [Yersinia pseudotuberculosis]|uniref:DUF3828 domain-containing protein n=1 Tax=Yersinia pseudotuberculosis TaxID=633 RepID=UPI0005DCE90E|nr:DUF3828 domain-containing protein [Yersinia pseudotuberculosis]CND44770.1 Protein of uncharacterised function (DUF3828) [Yersinia pseudotuberculosis]
MRVFCLFCFSLLSFTFFPQTALAMEDPSAFLKRIYAPYGSDDLSPVPIDRTEPERIVSKRFMAVLQEDQALTLPGDQGYLGYDPICQCQDYQDLVVTNITILANDNKKSQATVTSRAFIDGSGTVTTTFNLVAEDGHWFIDDIFDASQASIRDAIDANNKALRIKGETH